MAVEDVPVMQKRIIAECQSQGKPVIVATQVGVCVCACVCVRVCVRARVCVDEWPISSRPK